MSETAWFPLIGFVFALAGVWMIWSDLRHSKLCTARTEGVITGIETTYHDQKSHDFPVVRYAVDGVEYSCWGAERAFSLSIKIGREVTVLYNPDDPNICMVAQDRWRRKSVRMAPAFLAMGVLFIVLGFTL